ncbi:MAG: DpnD/PcfM family protein [Faecalibacterium prausnitzii]|nr:DpnD/PcfM family protein [Faecalibacterium prausnitzii]
MTIEELISQTFDVMAENETDARRIVEEKYKSGEFVLEPGEVTVRHMAVTESGNDTETWMEF